MMCSHALDALTVLDSEDVNREVLDLGLKLLHARLVLGFERAVWRPPGWELLSVQMKLCRALSALDDGSLGAPFSSVGGSAIVASAEAEKEGRNSICSFWGRP